jgi:translation initiation factor IF-2
MNNGKVRIYELSRELNLDNRDILAVCDQLNILVKSHSSTITEFEAEQIRSAAEKTTADKATAEKTNNGHPSLSKPNPSNHHAGQVKKSVVQPPVKKQQILEIRRHRPIAEPPKRPEMEAPSPAPVTPSPELASQPPRPVVRPNAPNRPLNLDDSDRHEALQPDPGLEELLPEVALEIETPLAEEEPAALVSPPPRPDLGGAEPPPARPEPPAARLEQPIARPEPPAARVERPAVKAEQPVARVERPATKPEPSAAKVEPPAARVEPPAAKVDRPAAKVDRPARVEPSAAREFDVIQTNPASRPLLKRARVEADQPESIKVEMREPPSRPRLPSANKSEESTVAKPRTVIELRGKPVRPGGKTAEPEPGSAAATPGAVVGADAERRPTIQLRGTAPKRGKEWEEEEDDEQKLAAKVGTKAKRRVQVIEDEDEDIDEALNGGELTPIQVSLSLERPPKPKNRPGQSKPTAAVTPAPKSKSRESSRGFRRDRREQEAKPERPEKLILTGSLSVSDLATALGTPETDIIKTLFFKGIAANINQILDIPTATMVAQEIGVEVETAEVEAEARKITEMLDAEDLDHLIRRPPVVTIMGHVDHGKTTLLDSIRKTKVAQGEAGGITQHIGAYHVDVEHEGQMQQVVFLDTPGHEAFTAMRARGARVTDIAVLVVAADDGVRPQTIEAISHAKAAEVPIVVAINKIDKEGAQPERVKQELTEYGLVSEEWGGNTIMVPVSAIRGENLDTLLEMILLVAEVEDLYANPDRSARGTVIEAHLDKARGSVATLLIQNGTLRVGDILVAGSAFGKVRAMVDDRGDRVDVASPSFAVEVLGLSDVPAAGDDFEVYTDEKEARSTASNRTDQQRQSRLQQAMASRRVSLNTLSAQAQEGELKELNLILKSDVQGSLEAILGSLQQLPQREVQVRVLFAAPGEITETDVDLASASEAVIVGFNTTLASGARQAADQAGVDVREYNIIYKLLEDIQGAMEGLLEPEMVEEPLGQVEVRAVFPVGRGAVAGCYVLSGKAVRNCRVRVQRSGSVVHEGNLDSLKRMKDDAKEVAAGYECGIGLDNFSAWQEGDLIDTFRLISKRRTLSA